MTEFSEVQKFIDNLPDAPRYFPTKIFEFLKARDFLKIGVPLWYYSKTEAKNFHF